MAYHPYHFVGEVLLHPVYIYIYIYNHEYSAQGQVLHCKLRNQGCSLVKRITSTANSGTLAAVLLEIDAVASRCFPHLTLSLASEQTLKELRRSQGHQLGGEDSGFG